jgi:hypothetical protein
MTIGFIFWLLMIIWIVFGGWTNRTDLAGWGRGNFFLFVLLFLLGWATFGWPIRG